MKRGMVFAGVIALGAIACSSGGDASSGGSAPVSSGPLAGTVYGKPFEGKSALARASGSGGSRLIEIYETPADCRLGSGATEESVILLSVPWVAGTVRELGSSHESQTATFSRHAAGETTNVLSLDGRVEIIEAPAEPGAKGKLRLRAAAEGNEVEGEVSVEVCE